MDKLKKLEQIVNLVESDKITRTEFAQLFESFITVVKELKKSLEDKIDNSSSDSNNLIKEVAYSLTDLELKTRDLVNNSERSSLTKIKELSQRLSSEINRVEYLIPEVKDYTQEIANLDRLIKSIPAQVPQVIETGETIVDKINSIEEDGLQIDASHIKNLPKSVERIVERIGGSGASMVRVLDNGAVIGDTVTEINFTNATSITYTGGATGRRANITTGSSGGGSVTIETPSGALYDQDTGTGGLSFTSTATAVMVFSDGITYFNGAGCTISGTSITLDSPATQYIRCMISSSIGVETPSGLVDSSNTTYTVTATPKYIVADGTTYFENNGYTIVGLTVTMTSEPTQYIRSIY